MKLKKTKNIKWKNRIWGAFVVYVWNVCVFVQS